MVIGEEMRLAELEEDELKELAQDYLRLENLEFAGKYNLTRQNVADELDIDPKLSDKFNGILDESFGRKMKRECYATIAHLVDELGKPGLDINIQRVAQQSLQTLMTLQKSLGTTKKKGGDFESVLEELGN